MKGSKGRKFSFLISHEYFLPLADFFSITASIASLAAFLPDCSLKGHGLSFRLLFLVHLGNWFLLEDFSSSEPSPNGFFRFWSLADLLNCFPAGATSSTHEPQRFARPKYNSIPAEKGFRLLLHGLEILTNHTKIRTASHGPGTNIMNK